MITDSRPVSPVAKVGFGVMVLSLVLWIALPVVPFLPLAPKQKAFWALVVFVAAEVTFYLGLALVGKEAYRRFRDRFRRKRKSDDLSLSVASREASAEDEA
jgi:hypothetical protein